RRVDGSSRTMTHSVIAPADILPCIPDSSPFRTKSELSCQIAWRIRPAWRIWYPLEDQILHITRLLHVDFALAVTSGVSGVPGVKGVSGAWLRDANAHTLLLSAAVTSRRRPVP